MFFVNVFLNVLIFTGSVLTMRTFFVIYFVVHYLYVLLQAVARPHNLSAFITGKCVLTFVLAFPEKQMPNQIISWEPALWTLMSGDRVRRMSKKALQFSAINIWLLSIEIKTKVVQHVARINLSYFKFFSNFKFFQIFYFFQIFKCSLVPSFCLTFRHFFY